MKGISDNYLQHFTLHSIDDWQSDRAAAYSGSDRKDGVISPDGARYLIKYAEEHTRVNHMDTSYVNNVLSEYVSSHILQAAGFPVHETFVAVRNQELLVSCKNFLGKHAHLIEFGHYMKKHYDSGEIGRIPRIEQIRHVLGNDPDLKPQAEHFWNVYWERFIGDALTGNFDRHMGNWGYIYDEQTQTITEAPIYDNGSTLYPALSEKAMKQDILVSPKEIARRALLFPKAALIVNGRKASYLDMLSSGWEPALSNAVCRVVPKITASMRKIHNFIENVRFLSDTRKIFYQTILKARMDLILIPAYERCMNRDYDKAAYDRLNTGEDYSGQLFERHWEMHQDEYVQIIGNIQQK